MSTIASVLELRATGDGAAVMAFPRTFHGAFGGAFGGLVAAGLVHVARASAPERVPVGVDCHFVRGLPAGDAKATSTVVHAGRSLTCVRVDLHDERERLATTATVSLADPAALHPLDVAGPSFAEPAEWRSWGTPPGVDIPIVTTLAPRLAVLPDGAIASLVRVPWEDPDGAYSAESACVAADFCVGPPVATACQGTWLPHPNPDISLRFTALPAAGAEVVGIGRVVRIAAGLVVVGIEVSASGEVFAAGAATSMVLRGER